MADKSQNGPEVHADYPLGYDVPQLRERRYLWTARILAILLISSILGNVAVSMAIFALAPLKEVRPFLVQFAHSSDVVATIQEFDATVDGNEILRESLVRTYVINRHTIMRSSETSEAAMTLLWSQSGYMGLTSTPEEYDRFAKSSISFLNDVRRNGGHQQVKVNSVSTLIDSSVYQIDFTISGFNKLNEVVSQQSFVATMEIGFEPKTNLTHEQMLLNPLGFTVRQYTISQKAE